MAVVTLEGSTKLSENSQDRLILRDLVNEKGALAVISDKKYYGTDGSEALLHNSIFATSFFPTAISTSIIGRKITLNFNLRCVRSNIRAKLLFPLLSGIGSVWATNDISLKMLVNQEKPNLNRIVLDQTIINAAAGIAFPCMTLPPLLGMLSNKVDKDAKTPSFRKYSNSVYKQACKALTRSCAILLPFLVLSAFFVVYVSNDIFDEITKFSTDMEKELAAIKHAEIIDKNKET